jgi:hypothetical protein
MEKEAGLPRHPPFLATESDDLSKITGSREIGDFHRAVIGEIDERLPIQDSEPL